MVGPSSGWCSGSRFLIGRHGTRDELPVVALEAEGYINESCPTCAIILNGPKFLRDSVFEGLVVQRNVALTKAKSLILKSGVAD